MGILQLDIDFDILASISKIHRHLLLVILRFSHACYIEDSYTMSRSGKKKKIAYTLHRELEIYNPFKELWTN